MSARLDRRARETLGDERRVARHDAAVWHLRLRRDAAVGALPDYAALRDHAAALRRHALSRLGPYLEAFEARAREAGAVVHWAADAGAHNAVVLGLLRERGVRRVMKSKSMLTEECGLNPELEAHGIEVVDSDLGERIVQLGGEPPSHIVVPAVHRTREEIGVLFERHMAAPVGEADPERLVAHARRDLRRRFLGAQAGLTGVNFAVAETGSIVVCTNEGNADLGTSLPPLHVASMGIDKVIPRMQDLATLLRLLARSATGQALTSYTSVFTGPRPGAELHVVIVDNGRTRLLADPVHRESLACIRCGACLNTCPVYRRAGGHAYQRTIPGPIGAVLAPALGGDPALAFGSTLCGSCSAVCPVGIDLHGQLLAWRRERPARGSLARAGLALTAALLARPRLFRLAGRVARRLAPLFARPFPGNPAAGWLRGRALPELPRESFAERFRRERGPAK